MKERVAKIYVLIGVSAIITLAAWFFWVRPLSFQSESQANTVPAKQKAPTRSVAKSRESSKSGITLEELIEGAMEIPTKAEMDAFLREHGRSESNLLAANTLTSEAHYLEEALQLFPDSPSVLVAILSQADTPENAVELATTLTFLEPDNALNHYLFGKALLAAGEIDAAFVALSNGASASAFKATFKEQVEGLTTFHEFRGASPDLALIKSVFGGKLDHLQGMRQLTRDLTTFQTSDDLAVSIGVAMGNHLSQGEGNNLLINQLVGLSIEKKFLESQAPETYNPFLNQTHKELLKNIEGQHAHIKELVQKVGGKMDLMTTEEAANFARIMLEEGEEAAIRKTFPE